MRSFRKPGRYKRNLHSTYCREHPLVKSLSNIYPCLLKGLSLIAREVSPKKGNNIPFITSNFRKKKGQGRGCYSLLYFSLYPSNSFNSFHFLRFRIHHGTFSKPIHPFYHSIIRYSHILRSISIFSPLLHPSSHPRSISFPSFLFSSTFTAFSPRQAPRLSTNSNVALFLIIPPRTKGDVIGRNKSKEISSARSV